MVDDGGASVRIDVPVDLAHLGEARSRLVDAARSWGFSEHHELEVVVSELITNAIRHSGAASAVEARLVGPGRVEVAVSDHGAGVPAPVDPYEQHTRGHGLRIVDAFAASWGVRPDPHGGKTVWALLDAGDAEVTSG